MGELKATGSGRLVGASAERNMSLGRASEALDELEDHQRLL